jgi:hypothetical protein
MSGFDLNQFFFTHLEITAAYQKLILAERIALSAIWQ